MVAVDAHHVVAMVEFFEHAVQLATQPFCDADTKDVSHFVGAEAKQPHFTGVLEYLVDRKVTLEDEITAVFDLIYRIVTLQIDGGAVLSRELRAQ